jgi:hypothetical protein
MECVDLSGEKHPKGNCYSQCWEATSVIIDSGSISWWEAGGLMFFTFPVLPDIMMTVSICDQDNIHTSVIADENHNPEYSCVLP